MKSTIHTIYAACIYLLSCMTMASCGQEETASMETKQNNVMQFRIAHPSQQQAAPVSRATETSFETNEIGRAHV